MVVLLKIEPFWRSSGG